MKASHDVYYRYGTFNFTNNFFHVQVPFNFEAIDY